MTKDPAADGKPYLATVIDLYSRHLLGTTTCLHPDAKMACAATKMACAATKMAAHGRVDVVN